MHIEEIEREAREILAAETHRAAVDREVARLRERRSLWSRIKDILPFSITIKRKNHVPH